ncbi:MAG TPA: protein kinase [Thermoanaerobaculia bacterium]|nr:protein kinase [Thermoanaerobaculia bacterium]
MSLQPGVRLGVFEILGPLGAGGMGEVYRARDTRLGREVAIKVLPAAFSGDPRRVARFEREARLLASINHPAIAAIYGAEEEGDVRYLAMELVPGETLAGLLSRGPIPIEESLQICRQIADGLEAAHERGVVHRDLKPANIKVTPDGRVKILDLGLAKAMELPASDEGLSESPTRTLDQTRPGTILGTVEFMSPEQARGKDVDKRTDIWAFGCVLFEMLSGRRAFTGETASDILASILTREPDWSALPPATPPRVRELLAHCLQKNANERLRDIGDSRIEISRTLVGAEDHPATAVVPRSRRLFLASAAFALLLGAGVWIGIRAAHSPAADAFLPQKKYLAVLLKNLSSDANDQLIADGFAETVSARVGRDPHIQVVTPSAATAARERNADPYEAANRLHANLLVRGTFQREGDRVRLTFFVENAETRRPLFSDQITGPSANIFAIQDEVAEKVARCLGLLPPSDSSATGLKGSLQQDRYLEALGLLQRYEKGDAVDEATRLLLSLVKEGARSALVQAALARSYLYKYDLTKQKTWSDQALAACARAREINPNLPEVHVTSGEVRNRTGKPEEALKEFHQALLLQPDYADAIIGRGDSEKALGRLPEAERSYRRAVQLQPGNWSAYNSLGKLFYQQALYGKAAEAFQRVTELSPDNSRAYFNLGVAYYYLQRPDDARTAFRRSIQLQPTGFAYSNLGTLEFSAGNYLASVKVFEEAIRQIPGDYQLWYNLGDAYRWAPGQRERATAAYEKSIALGRQALEVNPMSAATHATLARSFAKVGKQAEASREMERALELDPKSADNLYKAAVVAAVAGRRQEALEWISRAAAAGFPPALLAGEPEFGPLRGEADFLKAITPRAAERSS